MASSKTVRIAFALAGWLALLAGCAEPALAGAGSERPIASSCVEAARPQYDTADVGAHHIQTLDGWTRGGRAITFPWQGNPDHLVGIHLKVEWDPNPAGTERLAVEIRDELGLRPSGARGPFEGTSPIERDLALNATHRLGEALVVGLGMPYNNDLPVAMSHSQIVGVTVVQRFAVAC